MTRQQHRVSSGKAQKIFGLHPVFEAIDSGKELEKVLIDKDQRNDRIKQLKDRLYRLDIPFQMVPKELLNRLAGPQHQGVLAFGSLIEYAHIEHLIPQLFDRGTDPFVLILDSITDVRNFGAIARTAECTGIHAIVVPFKNSARINADAIKTSSGALQTLPV